MTGLSTQGMELELDLTTFNEQTKKEAFPHLC